MGKKNGKRKNINGMSYFKKPVVVEKRKLGPNRWKKSAPDQPEKPVYSDIEKQLHKHSKRNSTYFPPSWWLPGEK